MAKTAPLEFTLVGKIGSFSYSGGETPTGYICGSCKAENVKLWRSYQMFLDNQSLLCAACALKEQGKDGPVMADGTRKANPFGWTDQIGWRVCAVPTEDGDTFWGYSSVPEAGMVWWRRLPTHPVETA